MSSCCDEGNGTPKKKKLDKLFWVCFLTVVVSYVGHLVETPMPGAMATFFHASFELMNKMWWGIALGAFFVGLLDFIPREIVIASLGQDKGLKGIIRATIAGLLLDLCSHGILLVGMKLYKRGARLSQVMAFLIASPWNSLSLTLILVALIGLKWTLLFILFSGVIAIISGLVFESLVDKKILPGNPNTVSLPDDYKVMSEIKGLFKKITPNPLDWGRVFWVGTKDSIPILKWLFLGVIIAGAMRAFVSIEHFQSFLGPTALGLLVTLVIATVIEVCSEGSTPIAADIFTRAGAPGNSFAFLMTGVSTDYTEIMSLKETTSSWKIALFLPLITLPQVILIAILVNVYG